jgi:hypothetical protein
MAFPARYNYLYRIEAHWPTLINALLRFGFAARSRRARLIPVGTEKESLDR